MEFIKLNTTLRPSYSLFTNGTIFTEDLAQLLRDFNVLVTFSIDGNRKVFEMQRNAKFFDIVQSNIIKFADFIPYRFNTVFTPNTVNMLEESFLYLSSLKPKEISFTPDNRRSVVWTQEILQQIIF